jgi:fatty-acyl-CoA synthase
VCPAAPQRSTRSAQREATSRERAVPLTLTQADVDRAVAAEAETLRAMGVAAGHTVAWLGLNGLRPLALLGACRLLGARYLPLNWRLAGMELAVIVQHAGVQWLLHDEAQASLAAAVRELAALPRPPADGHEPGDLMLVYTSGTTGAPKGAVHTAGGMQANIEAAIDCQDLGPATRTLAVLPLFHVGGLCIQVLPTLAAGGTLRLHERFDPGAWLADVAAWRPTTSLLVPAAMRAIVEHPDWARTDLSSLAFVNSGSQVVPTALIEAFHARGVPVTQVYGSTETGPVSIVLRPEEAMAHVGRVGRPARGVQVRLAADGEILLKARNLLRSYHASTTPTFDDEGWFHTGDLAVRHPDGMYEVVGRSKELIISGGENIHPAEVENLLAGHPDVAECCVVGLPDARWGEVPVLVVVPRAGRAVDEAAMRALFDQRLARFKHPRRIVVADSLPKTALGKVQRPVLAARLADPTR